MIGNSIFMTSLILTVMFAGIQKDRRPDFKDPYPFFNDRTLKKDDGATEAITVPNGIPIGNKIYDKLFASTNGLITLEESNDENTPIKMNEVRYIDDYDFPLIAVFWTDLDPGEDEDGALYYNTYERGTGDAELDRASREVRYFTGRRNFSATWMFVATWAGVPYFCCTDEETLIIQGVLVTDGVSTYTMFNYIDVNTPVKEHPISVGWAANGAFEEHPASFTNDAFMMSLQPSNIRDSDVFGYLFYTLAEQTRARDGVKKEQLLLLTLMLGGLLSVW